MDAVELAQGLMEDFFRDIMDFESDQEPIGKVLQAFVQLLADSNVPSHLCPFLGRWAFGWGR